jgi:hypothetical protein
MLLAHEEMWRLDCRATAALAETSVAVGAIGSAHWHHKLCQVLPELEVRKLSYQGHTVGGTLSGALARPSVCSFEPTPTVEAAGQEQRAVPGKAHQGSMTIATLLIAACPRTWMTMTGRMGLQVQSAGDRPDHVLDACGPRRRSATARGARQSNSPCTPAGARS